MPRCLHWPFEVLLFNVPVLCFEGISRPPSAASAQKVMQRGVATAGLVPGPKYPGRDLAGHPGCRGASNVWPSRTGRRARRFCRSAECFLVDTMPQCVSCSFKRSGNLRG